MKRLFLLLFVIAIMTGLVLTSVAQEKPKAVPEKPKAAPEKAKAAPVKPAAFVYEDKIGVVKIKPSDPIHIACWMVVAGPDASLGTDTKRGVEIAIEDKGGKILGFPIKLSVQDTGCNAEGGQAAATKLAADPTIVAAVGSNCSSEAKPGAPILWKAGIATVSPSNTAPYLTDPKRGPDYDGYLRTCHNDKIQGAVAAEFAWKQLKVKRAATIHDGSVYAEQLQAVFAETFKKLGGTITSQEAVAPTDTDMRPVLTKIATGKPEFLYFPIFIAAGGHITRQVKEVRGLEKVALMGADGIFSPDFYKAAGETAVGMYHSSPDFSAYAGGYKAFLQKHQKKYGEKPIAPFHAQAYDGAMLIFAAIEKVAKKAPDGTLYIGRQKLRDALYATKNMKGLTGTISCDQFGDCADPKIGIYKTTAENIKKLELPTEPIWKPYAQAPAPKAPAKKEPAKAAPKAPAEKTPAKK
jgi:branched-chain amino acid transport system substrate-binding protein